MNPATVRALPAVSLVPRPGEPAWLRVARAEARAWLAAHGYPTTKDEDWRYEPLEALLGAEAEPVAVRASTTAVSQLLGAAPVLGGSRLVFVDGFFYPGLSELGAGDGGVRVGNLVGRAKGHDPRPLVGAGSQSFRHGFAALGTAFASDGAYVHLGPGAAMKGPLHLVFVTTERPRPTLSATLNFVVAAPGSRATLVLTHLGAPDARGVALCTLQLTLGEGAEVGLYGFQDQPLGVDYLELVEAKLQAGSRLEAAVAAVGGRLARHELCAQLLGRGAVADIAGVYVPGEGQCHDFPVLVRHAAPGATSRQVHRGVADGDGRAIFNGHVVVEEGAGGTDAAQSDLNLLLSDRAEVDTRPRLEIYADEVSCTHGAAVGQPDPEVLFYMRSRGLSEAEARALLVDGFVSEVVNRFRPPALSGHLRARLARRLDAWPAGGAPALVETGT
jgi:Fe-S cluster assembly protein SufD